MPAPTTRSRGVTLRLTQSLRGECLNPAGVVRSIAIRRQDLAPSRFARREPGRRTHICVGPCRCRLERSRHRPSPAPSSRRTTTTATGRATAAQDRCARREMRWRWRSPPRPGANIRSSKLRRTSRPADSPPRGRPTIRLSTRQPEHTRIAPDPEQSAGRRGRPATTRTRRGTQARRESTRHARETRRTVHSTKMSGNQPAATVVCGG